MKKGVINTFYIILEVLLRVFLTRILRTEKLNLWTCVFVMWYGEVGKCFVRFY